MDVFKGLARSVNVGTSVRVGLLLLVGLLVSFQLSVVAAQETPESEPTGKLVLVPDDLYVGETTDVLGFHLEYPDKAITIGYSEHFVPMGEDCDSAEAGTAAFTAPPARISLTACSTGKGRVQLKETDTGTVIAEATATLTMRPAAVAGQPRSCHELTGVICSPNAPTGLNALVLGQRDIAVTWTRLIGATKYEVEQTEVDAGNNTETIEVTGTGKSFIVDPGTEHSFRVRAFGDGTLWTEEWGLWSAKVTVTTETPSTMSIRVKSSSPSTITEGTSAQFTLTASPAPSFSAILIKIDITQEGDFLAPSQSSLVRLPKNSADVDRSISTVNDSTCEDDGSVTVTIGEHDEEQHQTYNIGRPSSAEVDVEDNDNCPPELTNPTRRVTYPENGTRVVATYTATDPENDDLTFSISGLDAGDFDVDPDSGELDFEEPPDYEDPEDRGRNNVYNLTVTVTDNGRPNRSDEVDVEVRVRDVNELPVFTNDTTEFIVFENNRTVTLKTAVDEDTADDVAYALRGIDASLFTIDSTGLLTFRTDTPAPNFEDPGCGTSDDTNRCTITVTATGGTGSRRKKAEQDLVINVRDVNEPPVFTSTKTRFNVEENSTGVGDKIAVDEDSADDVTYALSGEDGDLFSISNTGKITFDIAPDFEEPGCGTGNNPNICSITVEATGGTGRRELTAEKILTVTVKDVNETPVVDSGFSNLILAHGVSFGVTVVGKFSDPDGDMLIYAVSSSDDNIVDASVSSDSIALEAVSTGTATITVTAADRAVTDADILTVSDDFTVTVGLPAPTGLMVEDLVGYRGIQLKWGKLTDATSYLVKVNGNSQFLEFEAFTSSIFTDVIVESTTNPGWIMVTKQTPEDYVALRVLGLVPGTDYTFSVRGLNSSGEGPVATSSTHTALHPTHSGGHQGDHTAAYSIDASLNAPSVKVIKDAISDAAAAWNGRMKFDLLICDVSGPADPANPAGETCASRNSHMSFATIKSVAVTSPNNSNGCGGTHACVKPTSTISGDPNDGTRHLGSTEMIFEEMPYTCRVTPKPGMDCEPANYLKWTWTDKSGDHNDPVPLTTGDHRYLYGYPVVVHELGHLLGVPDFFDAGSHDSHDPDLAKENPSIMNADLWGAGDIQQTDLDQLHAIYRIHLRHNP